MPEKQASQIAWYPPKGQKVKIEDLKKKLFIKKNSDLIHRAIAELYTQNFPNKSWN